MKQFREFLGKAVKVTTKDGTEYIGIYRSFIIITEGEFLQIDDLNEPLGNNVSPDEIKSIEEYVKEEE